MHTDTHTYTLKRACKHKQGIRAGTHTGTHARTHAGTQAHRHTHTHARTHTTHTHTHTHIHTRARAHCCTRSGRSLGSLTPQLSPGSAVVAAALLRILAPAVPKQYVQAANSMSKLQTVNPSCKQYVQANSMSKPLPCPNSMSKLQGSVRACAAVRA